MCTQSLRNKKLFPLFALFAVLLSSCFSAEENGSSGSANASNGFANAFEEPSTSSDSSDPASSPAFSSPNESFPFQTEETHALSYDETADRPVLPRLIDDVDGELEGLRMPEDGRGKFHISITDAPIPKVEAIYLTLDRVEIRKKGEHERIVLADQPIEVDLLSLRDGLSRALGDVELDPGIYHHLTFFVSAVSVKVGGKTTQIEVPARYRETGIRILGSFSVKAGLQAKVLIDFDASRMLLLKKDRIVFRPVLKLRHIGYFRPEGIRLEEAEDGTMRLVGSRKSVRPFAWVQLTEVSGAVHRKLARLDGSFEFKNIPRVFGEIELAVVAPKIGFGGGKKSSYPEFDVVEVGVGNVKLTVRWVKISSAMFDVNFAPDSRFPTILASHLHQLFADRFSALDGDVAAFLSSFSTSPFRFLASQYVLARGLALPDGYVVPSIEAPYPFGLSGPDFDLPSYAVTPNDQNFYSGGPSGAGCADGALVFAGTAEANDYAALGSDGAIRKHQELGLPFAGLLAEYKAVCEARSLAELSCSTLGSLVEASNLSLPSISGQEFSRVMNSPRGGLITRLLSCVGSESVAISSVPVPAFPSGSQYGCWYGCRGGPQETYISPDSLLQIGEAERIVSESGSELETLDELVQIAEAQGVSPLVLMASLLADSEPSKVHGYPDRKSPVISNLIPPDATTTDQDTIVVNGLIDDRSVAEVRINGNVASFELLESGLIFIHPKQVPLVNGVNLIRVEAWDEAGNRGFAQIHVNADLLPQGVSELCATGEFVPKGEVRLGLSIDLEETAAQTIISGFAALGHEPTLYSDAEIVQGKPIVDGITVLAISRKVKQQPLTQDYIDGIRNYVAQGGSLIGEYDGAALAFSSFSGSSSVIPNLTPPLHLFDGDVAGGGAVLPLTNSRTFVADPTHPLMQGVPSSFLVGLEAGFAVTNFNSSWLHTSATFTSTGYLGLVPAGTFPAVLSGRCGGGRVVLFSLTPFQSMEIEPINILVVNALNWAVGIE